MIDFLDELVTHLERLQKLPTLTADTDEARHIQACLGCLVLMAKRRLGYLRLKQLAELKGDQT